jgi:23S rRNA pseudouridine1911/1915/1917 synthase
LVHCSAVMKTSEICHEFVVAEPDAGQRLDKFLADALADISRNRLKSLIEQGQVRVGGQTITEPAYRVKLAQDIILSVPVEPVAARPQGQSIPLNIVYEDDDLIVIDKAAGMVVHPAAGNQDGTLVNALIAHCGNSLSGIGGERRPGIVHRLDKDTTGLLVVAKHDRAHAGLAHLFETRDLERAYLAIAWGTPSPSTGRFTGNIGRSPRDRKKMAVLKRGGRTADTGYQLVTRLANGALSLVECRLSTGRTHQIRVHLADAGHALVGDPVYGGSRRGSRRKLDPALAQIVSSFGRQALHARLLGFAHPVTGEALSFESPVPEDMQALIELAGKADDGTKKP